MNYASSTIQYRLTLLNWDAVPNHTDFDSLAQEGHIRLKKNLRVCLSLNKQNELLVLSTNEVQSGVE
jgi:hypothetical protein